jgi:hypothetical protein
MITTKSVSRLFLLPLFSVSTIILLLSSMVAVTVETTYAQLLPKIKTGNNSTSPLSSVQTRLHLVKITSPTKGQEIPVRGNLTVIGTSIANSTSTNCEVSVTVNGIKPYQKAVPTGQGGANDYSTWNYVLNPAYAVIKQGQNKITAKFSCGNNPNLISHNSVNVTGVANINPSVNAPISQHVSLSNHNSKLLLISLDLVKNPINAGDKETLKTKVLDAANSNLTIARATVNGTVTDSTNTTKTRFNGTTDNSGIFSYTWKVSKDSKPGVFTVGVNVSAAGYQNQSIPTRTTFNVKLGTHHTHSSVNYSHHTLSIVRIPHFPYPQFPYPHFPYPHFPYPQFPYP